MEKRKVYARTNAKRRTKYTFRSADAAKPLTKYMTEPGDLCEQGKYRKPTYPSKSAAKAAAKIVNGKYRDGRTNTPYRCPACDLWHLTTHGTKKGTS